MLKKEVLKNNVHEIIGFFPVSTLIALVLAIIGNGLILDEQMFSSNIAQIIVWLVMGFFFFTWSSLHHHTLEGKGVWIAYLFATVIWLYTGYEIFMSEHTEEVIFFKSFFLTLGFILAYIYVPFLKKRDDNLKILFQIYQLRYALFRTVIFTILLAIALSIIGATFAFLFGLNLTLLLLLMGFNASVGVLLYNFLTTLMINPNEVIVDIEAYKAMINRYLLWLLYAFTAIIFTALNLFVLKIIITQELPEGQIAWMVMGFSVFAFMTYLSLLPYKDKIKKYNTLLWGTLVLQSLVLLASISIRVFEYGVTEKRYLLVAYGLWLLAISLYFLWSKTKAKVFWLFSTLSLVVLLSQMGPINGYTMSEYSQQTRLQSLYANLQKLEHQEKEKAFTELYDVISYLRQTHGGESIIEVIPTLTSEDIYGYSNLRKALGLTNTRVKPTEGSEEVPLTFYDRNSQLFDVRGYDYFLKRVSIDNYIETYILNETTKCSVELDMESMSVRIRFNQYEVSGKLEPLLKKLEVSSSPNKEEMFLLLEDETIKVKLAFFQMYYEPYNTYFTGFANIFIDVKDES
jgi:hypothetical protein